MDITKKCNACLTDKSTDEFYIGHRSCKKCFNHRSVELARKRRAENPKKAYEDNKRRKSKVTKDTKRFYGIKSIYNITREYYNSLLSDQSNSCAICLEEFIKTPSIDHDRSCCTTHKSCGKCVRGLLCFNCNAGLGMFKDNPDSLANAIRYLAREA